MPALTWRPGATRPGVLGVIAWDDAVHVVMPLRPRLLGALAAAPAHGTIPAEWVAALNTWQIAGAVEHVYHRPGADLPAGSPSAPSRRTA